MKKEEMITEIKKESKKQATKRVEMTKEERELNKEAFKAASLPVDFTDEDFVLGVQELDIRKLSDANYKQLMFRLQCIQVSQTRQLTQIAIDLERLIMLSLGTQGIPAEKIGSAINELVEKLTKEAQKFDVKEQNGELKA